MIDLKEESLEKHMILACRAYIKHVIDTQTEREACITLRDFNNELARAIFSTNDFLTKKK